MANTIQKLLTQIQQELVPHSETPSLDAQVLVAHFTDKSRSWVLAHPEAVLSIQQYKNINHALNRLKHGEPLPYVIGHWEFFGLDFQLNSDVLIPRPETELLVERGISWLKRHPHLRQAIDIGTGSGCIGIALATNIPDLYILLTDISPAALKVARVNAEKYCLSDRVKFQQADLLDGVPGSYDLICANLPYIPTFELMKLPLYEKEPSQALDGGQNGIELIARLLEQARSYLAPGGLMLLEIGSSQGAAIKSLAGSSYSTANVQILKDLSGMDRCVEIDRSNILLHLCQRREWLDAQERGIYTSESLIQEGFIHCSPPELILQVANRFYRGASEPVLLWLDPEKITSEIRWEAVDGTLFPHIYGPIDLAAVIKATDLAPDSDGNYHLM